MKSNPPVMTRSQAEAIAGTLSAPSKMPCYGYSIPASFCIVGSKLREVVGSTCSNCYACKNRYVMPNVQDALKRRFDSLQHPQWVDAMVTLILATKNTYFRWHDSGDLQSTDHLARIVAVCNATPNVRHWLPTREYKIVADYMKTGGVIPANLVIRLSAHMVNAAPPAYGLPTSTVHSEDASSPFKIFKPIPTESHACPSQNQGNKCGDCRACWSPEVANVSYHIH